MGLCFDKIQVPPALTAPINALKIEHGQTKTRLTFLLSTHFTRLALPKTTAIVEHQPGPKSDGIHNDYID
jgi:hypothetical protein